MYENFYNLKAKPFRLSPDPRFLYRSKTHSKALAYLSYGLQSAEGFIVITGGVGTGKTTLARLIMSRINKAKVIGVELVTSQLESDDMLRLVAAALGLAHQGLEKSTLLRNIETFLMARAREGKRVLLLVDEVQNLSHSALEELRMLSNFQVGDKALLQSFLLGQDEFRSALHSPGMEQFRQRIIAAYHLAPLNRDEIKEYILHRLRLCGWKGDPQFANDIFDVIYDYTDGVPRRVNKVCDRVLLHGCVEELHRITKEDVQSVIGEEQLEIQKPEVEPEKVLRTENKTSVPSTGGGNVQPLHSEPVVTYNAPHIQALEKKIEKLEATLRNDRKRFQRMIMMLALSDENDEELVDVLKDLSNADKK